MKFSYVNIVTKDCEGWINLFFGEHCIACIQNVWLADRIKESISEKVEPFKAVEIYSGITLDKFTEKREACEKYRNDHHVEIRVLGMDGNWHEINKWSK